ncbi:hypothetical protein KDL01_36170, partial [Actinospica durhamensis]
VHNGLGRGGQGLADAVEYGVEEFDRDVRVDCALEQFVKFGRVQAPDVGYPYGIHVPHNE